MRNDSRHGAAPQDESANSCIYNIHHIAPGNERPAVAETKCGIMATITKLRQYQPCNWDISTSWPTTSHDGWPGDPRGVMGDNDAFTPASWQSLSAWSAGRHASPADSRASRSVHSMQW